ncbi:MAG: hypothetical protein AB3N14_01275 [Flavobacteriaceae bacterium]
MKNILFLSMLCFAFSTSCTSKSKKSPAAEAIPMTQFARDSVKVVASLSKIYKSISEPDLTQFMFESYRFNYLDSFGNHRLFRIEHHNDRDIRLIVKYYDQDGSYESETYSVKSEHVIQLKSEQYNQFIKLLKGAYFWDLQMLETLQPMYLDGYGYLLEGFEPNRPKQNYHIVGRSVPHDGSFAQACEKLAEFYDEEKSNSLN